MPATVAEQIAYKTTFTEFVKFVKNDSLQINKITPEITDKFAQYLRESGIAVATHNRKIKRLTKIFNVLKEYQESENPFQVKYLRRKERKEQEQIVRKISFTREQEIKLLEALDDNSHKVMNKPEIRVVYHLGMFTGQRLKDCILLCWGLISTGI